MTDTLTVPSDSIVPVGNGEFLFADSGDPYNPAAIESGQYTLTQFDGTLLRRRRRHRASSTPRATAAVTRSISPPTGIASNSGRQVAFTRDSSGRITAITDPNGGIITYTYDGYGNLASVTDRANDPPTQFVYNPSIPHFVDHVVDPLGRTAFQASYGSQNRLSGLTDVNGKTTTLAYNTTTLTQTVTQPLTNPTTLTYDANGNVTQVVDPQGKTRPPSPMIRLAKQLTGETQVTGSLNLTTSFTYDSNGTLLTQTDPNGNTKRAIRTTAIGDAPVGGRPAGQCHQIRLRLSRRPDLDDHADRCDDSSSLRYAGRCPVDATPARHDDLCLRPVR